MKQIVFVGLHRSWLVIQECNEPRFIDSLTVDDVDLKVVRQISSCLHRQHAWCCIRGGNDYKRSSATLKLLAGRVRLCHFLLFWCTLVQTAHEKACCPFHRSLTSFQKHFVYCSGFSRYVFSLAKILVVSRNVVLYRSEITQSDEVFLTRIGIPDQIVYHWSKEPISGQVQ